jgi:predicted metal-dependent phosphoesterase TrpH
MPFYEVDLHTHTYYSDGRASPADLVERAAALGIKVLAIADHDNARGAREVLPIADRLGVILIPAAEFTCRWDACRLPPEESDVDVLGYYVDLESPAFRRAEEAALADFYHRVEVWCSLLSAAGYPLTLQDVLAQNPRYAGTLQLIQAVAAKGYGSDDGSAECLARSFMKDVPVCARTIEQAITQIHAAGGVAVLAHPSTRYIRWEGTGLLGAVGLGMLIEMGLDGIEVYHGALDEPTRAHFLALAKQSGLVVTGGSDEHAWPSGFPNLGREPATLDMVEALAGRASNYHRQQAPGYPK